MMDSIQSVKRKEEVNSGLMRVPQTQVFIPDDDEDTTSSARRPNNKKGKSSCFKGIGNVLLCLCKICFKGVKLCISCIAGIAVGSFVAAFVTGISMAFTISIAVASLPLLMVSFLITRALQFTKHGDNYDSAVHLKLFLRAWIYSGMSSLVIISAIFYGIAKNNQNLKYVEFRGTTLPNWIIIYFVIFGIYLFNWVLSVLIYKCVPTVPLNHSESGLNVPENVLEIVDCLIFWFALSEILKRVPELKNDKILGLNTHKWVEKAIFVVIGYNIIVLCTRLAINLLKVVSRKLNAGSNKRSRRYMFMERMMHLRYVVYCANGIKHNIDFILNSVLLLLTWVLYFEPRLTETHVTKRVVEIVTRTCVSLIVCSFLWLIKTCLLLSWEVRAVYNRLERHIIGGANQLYFLGIIGRHSHDILNVRYKKKDEETEALMMIFFNVFPIGLINVDSQYHKSSDNDDEWLEDEANGSDGGSNDGSSSSDELGNNLIHGSDGDVSGNTYNKSKHDSGVAESGDESGDGSSNHELNDGSNHKKRESKLSDKKKKLVKADLLMKKGGTPSLYAIQQAAHHFLEARETLTNEKYIFDILEKFDKLSSSSEDDQNSENRIEKKLRELIGAPPLNADEGNTDENNIDWKCFIAEMKEAIGSATINFSLEELESWMEMARNNCLFLANTLASTKEVVACLNNIISWVIVAVTFVLWLLLTGFATTQVLVIIASPLLAATFIFGDSCKTLFQGILFAYVVRPFDVGDLCIIETDTLSVKTIGVWITTFTKLHTREEVIYPNSELSQKKIINHKTNFDWNDKVELEVDSSLDDAAIKQLKTDIERFFNCSKHKYTAILVVETRSGNDIKITAEFRHVVDKKTRTYFQCHKEKHDQHSVVFDYIKNLHATAIKKSLDNKSNATNA